MKVQGTDGTELERIDCVYPATKNTEVELENTSLKMLKGTSERVSSVK